MANFNAKLKTDTKSLYNIKYGVFLRKILSWEKHFIHVSSAIYGNRQKLKVKEKLIIVHFNFTPYIL